MAGPPLGMGPAMGTGPTQWDLGSPWDGGNRADWCNVWNLGGPHVDQRGPTCGKKAVPLLSKDPIKQMPSVCGVC